MLNPVRYQSRLSAIMVIVMLALALISDKVGADDLLPGFDYQPHPGLPKSDIMAIFKDSKGFLWIGYEVGLYRYDGYDIKAYKHAPYDLNTPSSNVISNLFEDNSQNLWIMTSGGGLNRLNLKMGIITRFLHRVDDSTSLSSAKQRRVFQGDSGDIWILSNQINKLIQETDRKGQSREYFEHYDYDQLVKPYNFRQVNFFNLTNSSFFLWNNQLCFFDAENEIFGRIQSFAGLGLPNSFGKELKKIFFDESKQIFWMITGNLNLIKVELKTFQKKSWKLLEIDRRLQAVQDFTPLFSGDDKLVWFYVDESEKIWLGTTGLGLYRFNLEKTTYQRFYNDGTDSRTLSGNDIHSCYFEVQTQTLWVGNEMGLNYLQIRPGRFENYRPYSNVPGNFTGNRIGALYEDDGGKIWLTAKSQIHRFDPLKKTFELDINKKFFPKELQNTLIKTYCRDSRGYLWLGALNNHLYRYNPINGAFKKILLPNSPSIFVRSIIEDSQGYLWIGISSNQNVGLVQINYDGEVMASFGHDVQNPNSLSSNNIWIVYEDRKGRLWIGTWGGGLNLLDRQTGLFHRFKNQADDPQSLSDNYVTDIVEGLDGSLWFSTFNGGLNKLAENKDTLAFQRWTEMDGLPANLVIGMLEDNGGKLWLLTEAGLCQFNPQTGRFYNHPIGGKSGMPLTTFFAGAYLKSRSGKLYIGGAPGFMAFYPDSVQRNTHSPPVVLTSFKIFEKEAKLDTLITYKKHINLSHRENFLSFEFAALDFVNPSQNNFQYKLIGIDQDWVFSKTRRYARYTDVDPGEYIFRVKGSNNDGLWNERGVSLRITITPPFWQTWWFRSLGILAAGLLFAGIIAGRRYYKEYRKTRYISHFKIIKKLGEGGMGTVYKARDKNLGKIVALKVLNENLEYSKDGIKRFLKEAEIARHLDHKNIVKLFNAGSDEKVRYISMEFLEGQTLKEHIQVKNKLDATEVVALSLQILEGLKEIHTHQIIHKDLKSANIMIMGDGRAAIMDFGLASANALMTIADRNQLVGTLAYMSPEQTTGTSIDYRADIYSFGVILYEMIFGELPFIKRNEMALIYAIHNETPPRLRTIEGSENLEIIAIIAKCLEKEAGMRYQSADELLNILKGLQISSHQGPKS